jgi:integrase
MSRSAPIASTGHVDGGLELPLKVVQARLGHASIQMTADTCRSTRHA